MSKFYSLYKGELQRMKKYNILAAGFTASLIWIAVLHFTNIKDVTAIFPLALFLDATSMSMVIIGATMFFERQENTLKSIMISPVRKKEYILAKISGNITSNIITLAILYLYCMLFKEIHLNIAALAAAVILISFFHTLLGFIFTFKTRTFTDMLIGTFAYLIICGLPVILQSFEIIKSELFGKILYIVPAKSSFTLLYASINSAENWEIAVSTVYLASFSVILFLAAWGMFQKFIEKESGV